MNPIQKNHKRFQLTPHIAVLAHDYQDDWGMWRTATQIEVAGRYGNITYIPCMPPIKATVIKPGDPYTGDTVEMKMLDAQVLLENVFETLLEVKKAAEAA